MEQEQEKKIIYFRHPGQERRRASIFLAVLAMLALVLAFFAVDGGRNWDRVRRFFTYGTGALEISMESAAGAAETLQGQLAAASSDGVTLYDREGQVAFVATASLANPMIQVGGGSILVSDAGGGSLQLFSQSGELLLEASARGHFYDVDLSEDGMLCYITDGETAKSELRVYDQEQLSCFTVYAATRFFTNCAVAPKGNWVCAVALGENEGSFVSRAIVYRTDREEPVAELELGNQLIYDLKFWGEDTVCAIGEEELVVFRTDGQVVGTFPCSGVEEFSLNGDGFAVLVLPGASGDQLVSVDSRARETGRLALDETVVALDVNGKYVAWLTGTRVTLSGRKLSAWATSQAVGAASRVALCADGAAYLIDSRGASRYLP